MVIKLLAEQHLEFLSLKGGYTGSSAQAGLHFWKCHIVGNHMSRLICLNMRYLASVSTVQVHTLLLIHVIIQNGQKRRTF